MSSEQKFFISCNWVCKFPNHQTPEYCQLTLWHKPSPIIPKGVYGKWIYEGLVFKCVHPKCIYITYF